LRDAAFGCDGVGTPIPFQQCLMFIIATDNKGFQLTAGKFVPESKVTMLNVRSTVKVAVTNNIENVYSDIRQKSCLLSFCIRKKRNYHEGFVSHNDSEQTNSAIKY
jgi:hypothetical protein